MDELLKAMFGEYTNVQMLGYLWFFMIGYIIYGLNETTSRDIKSPKTPQKWSWRFWFFDNYRRYIVTILSTYIMFRFYIELCGHEFSYLEALILGFLGDGISTNLKKRVDFISANREKLMEKYLDNEQTEQN